MPPVNWDAFATLPGSCEGNFERLCRTLVRWHFGQFGTFAAQVMQPGVEFHLRLNSDCQLGAAGRWFGWQCRWYSIPGGVALGATRRKKIEEALRTTERILPDLTDWVLWTRRPLTAGDQAWFYRLSTRLTLHLWTESDLEGYLSGPALILRATNFGELVATPTVLEQAHAEALAPIKERWLPQVHQQSQAERFINRLLGRESEWRRAARTSRRLEKEAASLRQGVPIELSATVDVLVCHATDIASTLRSAVTELIGGDLERLRDQLESLPSELGADALGLPRALRAWRHPASLTATNLVDSVRRALQFLRAAREALDTRLVSVVAHAGVGKTHLAAQLTRAEGARPAGVLLHGRDLPAGGNLDDLARTVIINGAQVASAEALVAAVDAAGQRANRRLAIVIDGLNEAEDPRDWRASLARLSVILRRYCNVVVVCTLRPEFAEHALPPRIYRVWLRGFPPRPWEAIRTYFEHYKIDVADVALPVGIMQHPLTLRLFCEVANPSRANTVGAESMPASLTALFDRYLDQIARRVAQLSPRAMPYLEPDVRGALQEIGAVLWSRRVRSLPVTDVRALIRDAGRPWPHSLLRALEVEGVLIRVRGPSEDNNHVALIYDLLAGHVIADAEIKRRGRDGVRDWVRDPATLESFRADAQGQALGEDVFTALVGLLPHRIHGEQLWPLVPPPLQETALLAASRLEGRHLDAATVEALRQLGVAGGAPARRLFQRLWETRGSPAHPLNATFLEALIRPMPIVARDLTWTEWVRANEDELRADVTRWVRRWMTKTARDASDELRARFFAWLLTSTVRDLRDEATRVLYWFGRHARSALFQIAVESLQINDVFVAERLVGAAYGVAMAHPIFDPTFEGELRTLLAGIAGALIGPSASSPTNHWLLREYVVGLFAFAERYYPAALPSTLVADQRAFSVAASPVGPLDDASREEANETLGMDFMNYTLGRLVAGRSPYDMKHPGHIAVVRHVENTVWELGWRREQFAAVDSSMRGRSVGRERGKVERYGKKYGWIGFFTFAGMLAQQGALPEREHRLSNVDIDPSFPILPPKLPLSLPTWGGDSTVTDEEWISSGPPTVPAQLLRAEKIGRLQGPWLAVYASLRCHDGPRRVWGNLLALGLTASRAVSERAIAALLARGEWDNASALQLPSDHYTFAGEIPWHPEFSRAVSGASSRSNYLGRLRIGQRLLRAECFAHWYAWESYHTTTNNAGGTLVPSRPFSESFDLRSVPQRFHQVLPDGSPAALTVRAPDGFEGEILYLREDLLMHYCAGKALIWQMQGDRNLNDGSFNQPQWLERVYRERKNRWSLVWGAEDLGVPVRHQSARRSRGIRK